MKQSKNESNENLSKEEFIEPKGRFVREETERKLTQLYIFERVIGEIEKTKKSTDSHLDKLSEVRRLLSFSPEVNKDILSRIDLATDTPRKYKSIFPKEFYEEIYRLNGWDQVLARQFRKKREVALWTRELIYGRFNKETVIQIEQRNPYIGFCTRRFYHHQFLTPEGALVLSQILQEAVELMSTHKTWKEFRKDYLLRYKLAYQMSLFED